MAACLKSFLFRFMILFLSGARSGGQLNTKKELYVKLEVKLYGSAFLVRSLLIFMQ